MNSTLANRQEALRARLRQPADAGDLLAAAGAAIRRTAMAIDAAAVDDALRSLDALQIAQWLTSTQTESLEERLLRATLEAAEAALAESTEADTWRGWAFDALWARDELDSALAGAERWSALHPDAPAIHRECERLSGDVAALDRRLIGKARWLVALNEARRRERDLLDPPSRARAWWFERRAECDSLLAALAGAAPGHPHSTTCPECTADLLAAGTVDAPRLRHLDDDELWRFDTGALSLGERAVVEAHATRCPECAQALQALEDGDGFISEAVGDPPRPAQARRPGGDDPMRARRRETLAEHSGLRVVLVREQRRTRVMLETTTLAITRAELEAHQASYGGEVTDEGWEVDLPDALSGGATVTVYVRGKSAPLTFRVTL
ncbi:MAG TPA: hypothetical protein VH208_07305 [Myxococcaceae bacterium]|nr:hypothetical protein [Myxococcaceae bacterium]